MSPEHENCLMKCDSINHFLTMFWGLSFSEKLSILGNDYYIPQGTNLYRIRKADNKTNFESPKAWMPPPVECVKQGRFNADKCSVLYVASDPDWLEREVCLKKGDIYYLAKYVCDKDFSVGTLLNANSQVCSVLHCIAKAVENTNSLTATEIEYLNKNRISKLTPENCILNLKSPFIIHEFIRDIYKQTNKIGELVLRKNPNGIRYCSAYEPLESIGGGEIFTLDGVKRANYALTRESLSNIRFISAERKECTLDFSLEVFFRTMNETEDKNDKVK